MKNMEPNTNYCSEWQKLAEDNADIVDAARAYVQKYGSGTSDTSKRLYYAVKKLEYAIEMD